MKFIIPVTEYLCAFSYFLKLGKESSGSSVFDSFLPLGLILAIIIIIVLSEAVHNCSPYHLNA